MYKFTEKDLKEAAVYSKFIITRAEQKMESVFDFARNGKKYFELVDCYIAKDYVYAIDNVEYKLKGLQFSGYSEEKETAIFNELISVVKEQYGNLFKEMLEVLRIRSTFS